MTLTHRGTEVWLVVAWVSSSITRWIWNPHFFLTWVPWKLEGFVHLLREGTIFSKFTCFCLLFEDVPNVIELESPEIVIGCIPAGPGWTCVVCTLGMAMFQSHQASHVVGNATFRKRKPFWNALVFIGMLQVGYFTSWIALLMDLPMKFPTVLRLNEETPLNQYEMTRQLFDDVNYTCTFGKKTQCSFCSSFCFLPQVVSDPWVLESNTFTQVVRENSSWIIVL